MRRRLRILGGTVWMLGLLSPPPVVHADMLVVLKGRDREGPTREVPCVILDETDTGYRVELPHGKATYPKARVVRVERDTPEANAALRAQWAGPPPESPPAESGAGPGPSGDTPASAPTRRRRRRRQATPTWAPAPPAVPMPQVAGLRQTDPDRAIRQLIYAFGRQAARITIDGRGEDWGIIPRFPDRGPMGRGAGPRDIVELAIAPRAKDLCILLKTAEPPSSDPEVYYFNLDVQGRWRFDCQIGLMPGGDHVLWLWKEDGEEERVTISDVQWAIDSVVEIAIPYAALVRAGMREAGHAGKRPWVRVTANTWSREQRSFVDRGRAVASYRLLENLPALDTPLLKPRPAVRDLRLPVQGRWFVSRGPRALPDKKILWGCSFAIYDEMLRPARIRKPTVNRDYYAWQKPVYAPAAGAVVWANDGQPDMPPRTDDENARSNGVTLELDAAHSVWVGYFARNSVPLSLWTHVRRGELLGRVGNSGRSYTPRVRMNLRGPPTGRTSLPFALERVTVQLNPGDGDPWRRTLATWQPRGGVFVQTAAER